MTLPTKKPFYITTTLPYVNSDPHIGFAMEIVRADVIARYKKLLGYEVFFNTGTDEHGQKIYTKALDAGLDPQVYVDGVASKFKSLIPALNITSEINFIRTTDPKHILAAQKFWQVCDEAGFIYKKAYQMKYCVGCELEKTESELVDDRCPIHPNLDLEFRDEENYFFKFSAFENKLLDLYQERPDFVFPSFRLTEISNFIKNGLTDFSISRLKEKMPWGIEVPGDPNHVMYVWFDALVNYVSAIGWPDDLATFNKWQEQSGGMVQYAGKDNLRQQSAIWQAMLMAVGLPNSQHIVINGFINVDGQKMSKSLGNVVDPFKLIDTYGAEAVRYYLARHVNNFEDSDFSAEKFKEVYNANLANGLGNLVSRIMKMSSLYLDKTVDLPQVDWPVEFTTVLDNFDINQATDFIWQRIQGLDQKIQTTEPFKLVKTDLPAGQAIIVELVKELALVASMLEPIMPATSVVIKKLVAGNKMPDAPLFLRQD